MGWLKRKTNESKPKASTPQCRHQRQAAALQDSQAGGQPQTVAGDNDVGKCQQCKAESRRALIYRLKLIAGLLMPFVLQALDVTIIASAVPFIAKDFNEIEQLNWIVSAFNLTSASFIPFWGQTAEIFGRHASLQAILVLMLIGSALCTAAPTNAFPVLLLGRGFQGAAAAGIGVLTKIIISDKVSLAENAKNWSIFGLAAGLSYAIGPVVGGYLTAANWRWCFAINLPICVVAVFMVFTILRSELVGPQELSGVDENGTNNSQRIARRLNTIDSGGQVLFLFGFGLLILSFTWAGASYGWDTAAVIVPLVLGVLISIGWLGYEYLMDPDKPLGRKLPFQRAMVPWVLIQNRNVWLLFYINFATGMAMYSVLYFADLYFTLALGYDASKAGVQLLYYTPGIGTGVYLAMVMCNFWPLQTFWPLFIGSAIEALGIGMLAWAMHTGNTATIYGMIALGGVGTGMRFMPGTLHAIGFFPNNVASVVSLMGIAQPLGGALALTIMTTVYNNRAATDHTAAFVWAFVAICPFMVLCIFFAAFLGSVGIVKPNPSDPMHDEVGPAHNVIYGSYILTLLRGRAPKSNQSGESGESTAQRHKNREKASNETAAPLPTLAGSDVYKVETFCSP